MLLKSAIDFANFACQYPWPRREIFQVIPPPLQDNVDMLYLRDNSLLKITWNRFAPSMASNHASDGDCPPLAVQCTMRAHKEHGLRAEQRVAILSLLPAPVMASAMLHLSAACTPHTLAAPPSVLFTFKNRLYATTQFYTTGIIGDPRRSRLIAIYGGCSRLS